MPKKASPSFVSIKWRGSIVLWFVEVLENVLVALSPMAWIAHCRRKPLPMWVVDLWVATTCAVGVVLVFCFTSFDPSWRTTSMWVAVYMLLESLGVLVRDVILSPVVYEDQAGPFVGIREPRRWLVMVPIGLIPVTLAFATLYLVNGSDFKPSIDEPLKAVYFSVVTLTTLGYGDHFPITNAGRRLVIAELAFFILVVAVKLPIAISGIRVKQQGGQPNKRLDEDL